MIIWKTIPSYENYEASSEGEIKNIKTKRIMKKSLINGYYRVIINQQTKLVHRLVAETFLERKDFKIVHHKDNNKLNNSIDNLEWTTQSMNVKKAYQDGLIKDRTGINNPHYKNGNWIGKSKKYN
jgi:hypothetical protein